ncbi:MULTISPECIES: hypothetical protein [Burkholderia cepacia complex]|uniref:Uncharacterized protein n=1 Tax=Burkholderia contaminans TaxID=488447 RepID=A0A2S5DM48_9BURK|nr:MULTISPECIES: hypothetical protein [Burkholderia cepacia complex]KVR89446.1 hypothetical protein WK28_23830 [Burkholderia vietnamiensis]MBR7919749.1 hypothetical protein [Burkholderia vietnamiensis]MBR8205252.1 hypothetical protein [Burkholderia vietnamiensis]POZ80165.1 hypothetical protein C3743_39995 [Burkholderia contaminans]HDR9135073.1 hypothetical protein [Burkholderia vietnamiensis]
MTADEAETCYAYLVEAYGSAERWGQLIGTDDQQTREGAWKQLSMVSRSDPAAVSKWIDDQCCDAGRRRVLATVRQKRFTSSSSLVTTKLSSGTHRGLVRLAKANGLSLDETVDRLVRAAGKVPAVARELSHVSTK